MPQTSDTRDDAPIDFSSLEWKLREGTTLASNLITSEERRQVLESKAVRSQKARNLSLSVTGILTGATLLEAFASVATGVTTMAEAGAFVAEKFQTPSLLTGSLAVLGATQLFHAYRQLAVRVQTKDVDRLDTKLRSVKIDIRRLQGLEALTQELAKRGLMTPEDVDRKAAEASVATPQPPTNAPTKATPTQRTPKL